MWKYILCAMISSFITLIVYACCVVAGRCENELNGDYNDNDYE